MARKSTSEEKRIRRAYMSYRKDNFAESKWSPLNRANQAILNDRNTVFAQCLEAAGMFPLRDKRILDVGCGTGNEIARLSEYGAAPEMLAGIDLLDWRVQEASRNFPDILFICCNAADMPFEKSHFDVMMAYTFLSSIVDLGLRKRVAVEMSRVLKPGGSVIWYDMRYGNPQNKNVRSVNKGELRELFPNYSINVQAMTLMPPLARKLGRATNIVYPLLNSISLLKTHYFGLLTKPH